MSKFNVELDTTSPENASLKINEGVEETSSRIAVANFGTSDSATSLYQIKLWGDVDPYYDSDIGLTEEESSWISFTPNWFFKLSQYSGTKQLYGKIRDDVWNETEILVTSVTLTNQAIGEVAPNFVSRPIIGEDFEQNWSSEIKTKLPIFDLAKVDGNVSLIKSVSISANAKVSATRKIEFVTEATRLQASRWNKLINEDEELLLNL